MYGSQRINGLLAHLDETLVRARTSVDLPRAPKGPLPVSWETDFLSRTRIGAGYTSDSGHREEKPKTAITKSETIRHDRGNQHEKIPLHARRLRQKYQLIYQTICFDETYNLNF